MGKISDVETQSIKELLQGNCEDAQGSLGALLGQVNRPWDYRPHFSRALCLVPCSYSGLPLHVSFELGTCI